MREAISTIGTCCSFALIVFGPMSLSMGNEYVNYLFIILAIIAVFSIFSCYFFHYYKRPTFRKRRPEEDLEQDLEQGLQP